MSDEDITFSKLTGIPSEEEIILSKLKGVPPPELIQGISDIWGPPYTTFNDSCKREAELCRKYKWSRSEIDRYLKIPK